LKLKKFEWDAGKNQLLKETRNVCFEDVEQAILDGDVYQIIPHHNADKYPGQKIIILKILGYIHYVPFVEDDDKYFLKSIIPSRKLNRKH